jgi:hypothetical protein
MLMKDVNGRALSRFWSGSVMKIHDETEELTIRLVGLLRVDAKGRLAIRAVANSISLIFVSIAVAIIVLSTSYAKF